MSTPGSVVTLPRPLPSRPSAPPLHSCELCAVPLGPGHDHLVEAPSGRMLCACPACSMRLPSAASDRYRKVPRRVRILERFDERGELWSALAVPGDLAFFFLSSAAGGLRALYPGPGGPTPAAVDPAAWRRVVATHPAAGELRADVEALLVHRRSGRPEGFLVPIDQCTELVGLVRVNWRGFSGAPDPSSAVDRFFERLRRTAEPGREGEHA